MQLTTKKEVIDNVYKVTLETTLDGGENSLVDKFGEPQIEIGGAFTGPPAFNEPNLPKGIKLGSPFTFQKDADSDPQAKEKANVWASEVRQRMITELATLEAMIDDFTGTTTEVI